MTLVIAVTVGIGALLAFGVPEAQASSGESVIQVSLGEPHSAAIKSDGFSEVIVVGGIGALPLGVCIQAEIAVGLLEVGQE